MSIAAAAVSAILSGSCTPACDLLVLVTEGVITSREATLALRTRSPGAADVRSAAAAEIDYMRRNDI